LNEKGQGSFEMVFIAAIIFVYALIVFSNYFYPSESFRIAAQARIAVIEELGKNSTAGYVECISIEQDNDYEVGVYTKPKPLDETQLDAVKTAIEKITDKTVTVGETTQC
jgi:uncharacterized membrane protein YdfJ with MMPL/SSD domain